MDLVDLVLVARRRWYVVLPAVLFTLVAAVFARSSVELEYRSSGSVLLFAPRSADLAANPFSGFGSLSVPANVIVEIVGGVPARRELARQGAAIDYQIGVDPSNPAPLIMVVANGTELQALRTVELVLERVKQELEARQQAFGAPPDSWITTGVVSPPSIPEPQTGSQSRTLLAVLFLGLAATGALTLIVNSLLERKSGGAHRGRAEVVVSLDPDLGRVVRPEPVYEAPPRRALPEPPQLQPAPPQLQAAPPEPVEPHRLHPLAPTPEAADEPPRPAPAPRAPEPRDPLRRHPFPPVSEVEEPPAPTPLPVNRAPSLHRRHPYLSAVDSSDDEADERHGESDAR